MLERKTTCWFFFGTHLWEMSLMTDGQIGTISSKSEIGWSAIAKCEDHVPAACTVALGSVLC